GKPAWLNELCIRGPTEIAYPMTRIKRRKKLIAQGVIVEALRATKTLCHATGSVDISSKRLDVMFHRELFDVTKTRKMTLRVEFPKLLDRFGLKNVRSSTVQLCYQLRQRLRELAGRVSRRVPRVRDKVIDVHNSVLVRINESQV